MKILALLVFLAGVTAAVADDNLLKNGDFSNGITYWEGDCHTADGIALDLGEAPTTSGIIVKLRSFEWTKVTQDFDGNIGEYLLTITYAASSNMKFSDNPKDYTNVPAQLGFSRLRPFSSTPGDWVVIVNDLGAMHYTYWKISPHMGASGVQTLRLRVHLDSDASQKKGFYLIFPPGEGIINLLGLTLLPQTTGT